MHATTSVQIDASPEQVWSVLSDLVAWPTWTPTVTSIRALRGEPALGADFELRQPGLPVAVWEVAIWDPPQFFSWVSKAMGTVTEASHELAAGEGGTRVTLTVDQTGGMAPLLGLLYGRRIRRFIETEAGSLKARCERTA